MGTATNATTAGTNQGITESSTFALSRLTGAGALAFTKSPASQSLSGGRPRTYADRTGARNRRRSIGAQVALFRPRRESWRHHSLPLP